MNIISLKYHSNFKKPLFKGQLPPIPSYGFNGMEKDDEMTQGNYDFGARIYDSRLGRWLAVDPLFKDYVSLSPYCFAANSPLYYVDPDGRSIRVADALTKVAFESAVERNFGTRSPDGTRRRRRNFTDIILDSYTQRTFDGAEIPGNVKRSQKGSKYQNINVNSRAYRRAYRRLTPSQQVVADGLVAAINDEAEINLTIQQRTEETFPGFSRPVTFTTNVPTHVSYDEKNKERPEQIGITVEGGVLRQSRLAGGPWQTDANIQVPSTNQAEGIIATVIAYNEIKKEEKARQLLLNDKRNPARSDVNLGQEDFDTKSVERRTRIATETNNQRSIQDGRPAGTYPNN